jgi:hypothetical protein
LEVVLPQRGGVRIPVNSIADSGGNRSPNPAETDH